MLYVYVDESGTHGSNVTIVQAVAFRAEKHEAFETALQRHKEANGVGCIHAADLRHPKKEFKSSAGWNDEKRLDFVLGSEAIIGENVEFSIVVILPDTEYRTAYAAELAVQGRGGKSKKIDSRYGACFRGMLATVASIAEKFGGDWGKILVTVEASNNDGEARTIWGEFKDYSGELLDLFEDVIFKGKKEKRGLEAADLRAYPAFVVENDSSIGPADVLPVDLVEAAELPEGTRAFRVVLKEETLTAYRDAFPLLRDLRREKKKASSKNLGAV